VRCDVAQLELSARMDGEPNARLDRTLREHLATCEACRRFGSSAQEILPSVGGRPAGPVPDQLVVDVMRAVEVEPRPGLGDRRRRAAALVAGVAAIAVVAAGLALRDRQTPPAPLSALTELRARTLLAWSPGEVCLFYTYPSPRD
jgi:predicted anti-sigma-YlaC factor YlaD